MVTICYSHEKLTIKTKKGGEGRPDSNILFLSSPPPDSFSCWLQRHFQLNAGGLCVLPHCIYPLEQPSGRCETIRGVLLGWSSTQPLATPGTVRHFVDWGWSSSGHHSPGTDEWPISNESPVRILASTISKNPSLRSCFFPNCTPKFHLFHAIAFSRGPESSPLTEPCFLTITKAHNTTC